MTTTRTPVTEGVIERGGIIMRSGMSKGIQLELDGEWHLPRCVGVLQRVYWLVCSRSRRNGSANGTMIVIVVRVVVGVGVVS